MRTQPTPQGDRRQGVSPTPTHYACPCGGCIVTRDTYFRMINDERLRCPECNERWFMFASTDAPRTNEVHVDAMEDLIVHVQGEEERAS